MSLIFGFWNFGNKSDVFHTLQKMHEDIKPISYEKYNFLIKNHIGFGHMLSYNTTESINEALPIYLEQQKILFTAQGRIDNREHLSRKLNLNLSSECTDGFLISQAFLKWGKSSVNHMRGDWSFAVFDFANRELFIARDPMGYTAVYYYQNKEGFYFSSVLKNLLTAPGYQAKLNEEHFFRKLTLWDDDTLAVHSTFYEGIFSLPPNHTLTISDRELSISQYWQPQNIPIRRYKNKQDYADEINEIFTKAVKVRLRSYKPVAAMLSGGLDSSAVAFTAASLLKEENKSLTTFSHIPLYREEIRLDKNNKTRILDESPLITEVVRASGNIHPNFLNSSDYSVVQSMKDVINNFHACSHAASNIYWALDIYRKTSAGGFGTLLSGEGGNGSISFAAIDYLIPWSIKRFMYNPYLFLKILVAKPILYKYFSGWMSKRRGTGNNLKSYIENIFVRQPILDKYDILNDIQKNGKDFTRCYSDVTEMKQLFIELYRTRSEAGAARGHFYGFELRDPTTDIDLMEYFFSIPNEVFFDENYNNRMLVKRMMKGKVPDDVLFEKKKGLQSADIAYRVKAQAPEITAAIETVNTSALASYYIDTKKLHGTWKTYLHQPYLDPYDVQRLLKALNFAMFLQMNFD